MLVFKRKDDQKIIIGLLGIVGYLPAALGFVLAICATIYKFVMSVTATLELSYDRFWAPERGFWKVRKPDQFWEIKTCPPS